MGSDWRMEFIINSFIRIHPMALLSDNLNDPILKAEINRLTPAYDDKPSFFVDTLAGSGDDCRGLLSA